MTESDPRFLHDKNSLTADPNDADFVYAVWDRVQQAGRAVHAPENPIGLGFKGPIYFTRTTTVAPLPGEQHGRPRAGSLP